jgi:Fe(II)/alpha-ketoglutarate-dependent arginine beta-hydroxylase
MARMTAIDSVGESVDYVVQLNEASSSGVLEVGRLCSERFESPNNDAFVNEAWRWSQLLPHDCRAEVGLFRANHTSETMVVRGLVIDDAKLGVTPESWASADTSSSAVYGFVAVLLATLVGECISWTTQQHGRVVTDVLPTRGMEQSLVSSSSTAELGWHTEDAFSQYRADYVALLGLRDPGAAATTVAGVNLALMPAGMASILGQRRFLIQPDDSHDATAQDAARPVALLNGNPRSPVLRIDRDFTRVLHPDDSEARRALAWLIEHIDSRVRDVPMLVGDMTFISNRRVVHGRRAFQPRFDGTDRWLKRVNIVSDLMRTSPGRRDLSTRRIG